MATYTSNYGWTKPSGSDNVDISVLNDNLDDQDSTIHDAFLNMAPPFSESSTYAVDDIVLYTTGLYKCHTAVVTPGSWTGSTNWQVYKLSEGGSGGGGTSNYNDLTNKPSINGVTLSGNKTTSDLGITKSDVGLGNVPNVSTNDQTPTFTQASTRNNIVSGEKLSVILGKVQKFFNDLKTVAFSGSFTDLSNKPQVNSVELSGNKTTNDLGINADNVMMSDGVTSVEAQINADKTISRGVINSGLSLGFTIRWFKQFNIVNMRIENDNTPIPNGNTKIGTIPEGLCPFISMYTNSIRIWDNKIYFEIRSDGDIYVICSVPTGSSSPYYVQGCFTYLTPTI